MRVYVIQTCYRFHPVSSALLSHNHWAISWSSACGAGTASLQSTKYFPDTVSRLGSRATIICVWAPLSGDLMQHLIGDSKHLKLEGLDQILYLTKPLSYLLENHVHISAKVRVDDTRMDCIHGYTTPS
jgi:hypothetical protein